MAKTRADLPPFDVKEVFDYRDGHLFWKHSSRGRSITKPVGTCLSTGYRSVVVGGRWFMVHRLVYLFHTNEWPEIIDHIDGNKLNNCIENLRSASKSLNGLNLHSLNAKNKSGFRGVYWNKRANKWIAQITVNRKTMYLGCYEDVLEAASAVKIQLDKYIP
jgi:hypothetical protein